MTERKHTPLPWTAEETEIYSIDCNYHAVTDCSCNHTCRTEDECKENAAFITKACNAHYDLVDALKHCQDIFLSFHGRSAEGHYKLTPEDLFRFGAAAGIAQKALVKAKWGDVDAKEDDAA